MVHLTLTVPLRFQPNVFRILVINALLAMNGVGWAAGDATTDKVAEAADAQAAAMWLKQTWESASPNDLPFSFEMQGAKSREFLGNWEKTAEEKNGVRLLRWKDSQTGVELRVELTTHRDWPVVEWTAFLENKGQVDSPEFQQLLAADIFFEGSEFNLHGIEGDSDSARSFASYEWQPKPDTVRIFGPGKSGKSTSGPNGWPYFNLAGPAEKGRILVLGWPGQWSATFNPEEKGVRWFAGQERTHFKLRPGETVRFPSVTMMFWKGGDWILAQNLWRRWYREEVMPHPEGGRQGPLWNEQTLLLESEIPRFQKLLDAGIKPDICWMDAGDGWWVKPEPLPYAKTPLASLVFLNTTGFWEPDPVKFPKGFAPFGDWARQHGMKTVLWFEPERVGYTSSAPGAYDRPVLATEHTEWLLHGELFGEECYLNLGDPAALSWLKDHLSTILEREKIDWYREDLNTGGPYNEWRSNDEVEKKKTGLPRAGLTENFYIQGHLALWDTLRARKSGLLIDSCASGGRRNDLESMRRAVPLLRSDYEMTTDADKFEGFQGQTYGLSFWFPFYGGLSRFGDPYEYRSLIMPGFGMHGQSLPVVKKAYDEFRRVAPLMIEGDYYPLTPYNRAPDQWIAWQFHDPAKDAGILQAFRRGKNKELELAAPLRGLNPSGRYRVTNLDAQESPQEKTGAELMEKGPSIQLAEPRSAGIWEYRRLPQEP